MKAAFGFRPLVFFFAMRSPLEDAQSVAKEYHETGRSARLGYVAGWKPGRASHGEAHGAEAQRPTFCPGSDGGAAIRTGPRPATAAQRRSHLRAQRRSHLRSDADLRGKIPKVPGEKIEPPGGRHGRGSPGPIFERTVDKRGSETERLGRLEITLVRRHHH